MCLFPSTVFWEEAPVAEQVFVPSNRLFKQTFIPQRSCPLRVVHARSARVLLTKRTQPATASDRLLVPVKCQCFVRAIIQS